MGKFTIDLISSLPFTDIFNPSNPRIQKLLDSLGLLKLLRIARLSEFIGNLNSDVQVKVLLKMANLMIIFYLIAHVIGCIWFIVVKSDETWMLNEDFIWVASERKQIYFPDFVHQFLLSVYTAYYFLTGGEVVPQTVIQTWLCLMVLILTAMLNNGLLGMFALYSDELSAKATKLQ